MFYNFWKVTIDINAAELRYDYTFTDEGESFSFNKQENFFYSLLWKL